MSKPPESAFIDSNIWLYAFITGQDTSKSQIARSLVKAVPSIVISTQVINEVCVNLIKKEHFSADLIRETVRSFYDTYTILQIDQSTLLLATDLREEYSFSFWDSMIVASALTSGVSALISEDMQNGLRVREQLMITNPFA